MKNRWLAVVLPLAVAGGLAAQDKPEGPPPTRKPQVPLRVQVAVQKSQGEKRLASLLYTLGINADEPRGGKLRMGINVPLVTTVENKPQVVFKSVGTNIDCSAQTLEDGRYKLTMTVEQSSIYSPEGPIPWAAGGAGVTTENPLGRQPVLRDFSTTFSPILRDGQTAQYTAATDPLSGEVVKVEVTLNVVK